MLTASRLLSLLLMLAAVHNGSQEQHPYTITVKTQEVALTFRAQESDGRTISDLKQTDLKLLDNGKAPERITLFMHHQQLPVHLAIVLDISPSMEGGSNPREVARRVASTAFHDARDRALVMFFDFEPMLMQDWTSNPGSLEVAAAKAGSEARSRFGGTALWDSLYRICRDSIPTQQPGKEAFSSAVILFTDGIDNRSHALPEDVVEECQAKQTAIYPFVEDDKQRFDAGQKALRSIADLTGGRVFYQQTGERLAQSILQIDTDLRDRYTLVFKPANFKADGKFHTLKLTSLTRDATFLVRSGYIAAK